MSLRSRGTRIAAVTGTAVTALAVGATTLIGAALWHGETTKSSNAAAKTSSSTTKTSPSSSSPSPKKSPGSPSSSPSSSSPSSSPATPSPTSSTSSSTTQNSTTSTVQNPGVGAGGGGAPQVTSAGS